MNDLFSMSRSESGIDLFDNVESDSQFESTVSADMVTVPAATYTAPP